MNVQRLETESSNPLGITFLRHLISDQKTAWTSPARLRWADASWLFPLSTAAAGFLATDRAVPAALSSNPATLHRFTAFSSYGLYSMIGAGAGLYAWSRFSRDDHQRETAVLAGEATIGSLGVTTALKYAVGRERPDQGAGLGRFYQGGVSFPSDHSALAWSIASVVAHEYPGPLTQVAAYGLATTISAARVMGKEHFPSDVVVGAAIGWLMGREVYRAHHDPELGGGGTNTLSFKELGEEQRPRRDMGSRFVPLDSWVYEAFEKLAALGYIHTQMMWLKPWTRMECARLTEEAAESLPYEQTLSETAARWQARLAAEFARELALLDGGRNFSAGIDSVYARGVSMSGPALTDGYHFGQTIAYDFGRPFERGMNGQAGGSFDAEAGPLVIYIRAEYQHAPSAPALSTDLRKLIAQTDLVAPAQVPGGPIAPVNRLELLDSYAAVDLGNWELAIGRQSLVWSPSVANDSMLWSNNIEPIKMARLVNPEPIELPWLLRFAGPVRFDQFFGRLEGHPYIPKPFIYGNKINFHPWRFLEIGLARTVTIGGKGAGQYGSALTARDLIGSFFAIHSNWLHTIPGKNDSEIDWTFYVPKVHNYLVLFGDSYAADDPLPFVEPRRNPWNPGLYLTHFPNLPHLDFHIQGVSTETGWLAHQTRNEGLLNYYGDDPSGYTSGGNLIGNTVGREGNAVRCWLTYWMSPQDSVRFVYQHHSVNADFIPGGGVWADYAVRVEKHFRSGWYMKPEVQFEDILRYPALWPGPQTNVTAMLEVGFVPERNR